MALHLCALINTINTDYPSLADAQLHYYELNHKY